MKRKVKIGNKEIMLEANGLTPVKYREAFPGRDVLIEMMVIEETNPDDYLSIDIGLYDRLAYVMSGAQDDGVEFEEWLQQFGPTDIFMAAMNIMAVWNQNADSQSEDGDAPKKLQAEES